MSTDLPPTPDPLSSIIQAASKKLKQSDDLAETERSVNILKTAAEVQKLDAERLKAEQEAKKLYVDAALASKQLRLSYLSAVFAPLVPIASLLTVVVTLIVAALQTKQARELEAQKLVTEGSVREAANWESFRSTFDTNAADVLYSKPTFVSRLREFASTDAHRQALNDMATPFLSDLSSNAAFQQVWNITYKEITPENFENVVSLARSKRHTYYDLADKCAGLKPSVPLAIDKVFSYQGACGPKYSADDLAKAFSSDPSQLALVMQYKNRMTDEGSTLQFLSKQMSEFVRKSSNKQTGPKAYDLSDVNFINANLDEVDFSEMILNQTRISITSVKGAKLTPKVMTYQLASTAWWDAETIDQHALPWLISNIYPQADYAFVVPGTEITLDQYRARINKLCTAKLPACADECLKFGPSPNPVPPKCASN